MDDYLLCSSKECIALIIVARHLRKCLAACCVDSGCGWSRRNAGEASVPFRHCSVIAHVSAVPAPLNPATALLSNLSSSLQPSTTKNSAHLAAQHLQTSKSPSTLIKPINKFINSCLLILLPPCRSSLRLVSPAYPTSPWPPAATSCIKQKANL